MSWSGCWLRGAHISTSRDGTLASVLAWVSSTCDRPESSPPFPLPTSGWGDSPACLCPHFLEASWSQVACEEREAFQEVLVAVPCMSLRPPQVTPRSWLFAAEPGGSLSHVEWLCPREVAWALLSHPQGPRVERQALPAVGRTPHSAS